MSKVSVFRFNLGARDANDAEQMMKEYVTACGLQYDYEEKMYTTPKPPKKKDAKNVALSAGATLLTGRTTVYYSMGRGISYAIEGNQLVIRACTINRKMKNTRQSIHSTFNNTQAGAAFYNDLKSGLFKKLEANGIKLASKEVEKIDDGSGKLLAKRLSVILVCVIIFVALIFLLTRL